MPAPFSEKTFFYLVAQQGHTGSCQRTRPGRHVDSYVWDSLQKVDPQLVAKTRIVWKSEPFGFPPIVADHSVSKEDFDAFQDALFRMKDDPAGRALLDQTESGRLCRRITGLYKGVTDMMRDLGDLRCCSISVSGTSFRCWVLY